MEVLCMLPQQVSYQFTPGRRSVLAEIYFPRRIATQGTIYDALADGLNIQLVRSYLRQHTPQIMDELAAYPHWFDPNRYVRAVLYRVLSQYREADDYVHWSDDELNVFLFRHSSWPDKKQEYARLMFPQIARSIGKWIDDSGLFIFGFLVRQFWEKIAKLHKGGEPLEDEIWVTSIFHMDINVLSPKKLTKKE
jgi:hypothetical protein